MRKFVRKLRFEPLNWARLIPWKGVATVGLPLLVATGIALWIAQTYMKPSLPERVVLAGGPEGSAYAAFGDAYGKILARERVKVTVLETAGARENYRLLRDGKAKTPADVAFVRGGIGDTDEAPNLVSLGVVGYEALWVF